MDINNHRLIFDFEARISTRFNIQSEAALEYSSRRRSGQQSGVNAARHSCPFVSIRG
jgi:hypothetical protein